MDCWACGEGLRWKALYHLDDEECRYPLCIWCYQTVDLRLMLMEAQAQGEIDRLAESEIR